MDYQDLLNYLIDLTNVKITKLAESLNYDISYISKWIHGKRRPSKNNVSYINDGLAKIFAKTILRKNLLDKFVNDLSISLVYSSNENLILDSLEKNIYTYLNLAYEGKLEVNKESKKGNINYVIGHTEIESALINIFKHIFACQKKDLNIWVNVPILLNFSDFLLNLIANFKNDGRVINLNFLYSRQFVISDVRKIFHIFSKYPSINFEIYENKSSEKLNFIAIDNYFFADISLKESTLLTMTYSFDTLLVKKFLLMAKNLSSESNKLVSMVQSQAYNSTDFLRTFYSRDKYIVVLNFGLEYMISKKLISELSLSHKLKADSQIFLHKVYEILEYFFEQSSVDLLLPSDILEKSFRQRIFYFYDYKFKLNDDQYDQYIENIVNTLKKNPKFHLYLVDESIRKSKNYYHNFNIYYNGNLVYLKKLMNEENSKSQASFTINNNLFNDIIAKDLKTIISDPSTNDIKYYQLRKIYQKIKSSDKQK